MFYGNGCFGMAGFIMTINFYIVLSIISRNYAWPLDLLSMDTYRLAFLYISFKVAIIFDAITIYEYLKYKGIINGNRA